MTNILIASGIDPSGHAGMSADYATILSLGGRVFPVVTALTVQSETELRRVVPTERSLLQESFQQALTGEKIHAIKCGLLMEDSFLASLPPQIPCVIDPVMTHGLCGEPFLSGSQWQELFIKKIPRIKGNLMITPNHLEAETLIGHPIITRKDSCHAAKSIFEMGYSAVVIKGGEPLDLAQNKTALCNTVDILYDGRRWVLYETRWLRNRAHVRATGCALASCLALMLGRGYSLKKAVEVSCLYLFEGLRKSTDSSLAYGEASVCAYERKNAMVKCLSFLDIKDIESSC